MPERREKEMGLLPRRSERDNGGPRARSTAVTALYAWRKRDGRREHEP